MTPLTLHVHRGLSGLEQLSAEWLALCGRVDEVGYQHLPGWYRAYLDALAPDPDQVVFCALRDRGALVAVLPLERAGEALLGVELAALRLPAHPHVPHGDFTVARGYHGRIELELVWRGLARATGWRWDVTVLSPILADAAAARVLAARPPLLVASEPYGRSDAIAVAPYDDYLGSLSKNFRGALRKARNQLAKLDQVRVERARDPVALAQACERFFAVEASGWKAEAGTAIALDPRLRRFYQALCTHLGAHGQCEINLLLRGDDTLAAQFAVRAGARLYLLKIGHDESYRKCAPGNLLLEHLLRRCGEAGAAQGTTQDAAGEDADAGDERIEYVDLVSGASWHRSWRPVVREVSTHYLFRPSLRGLAVWAALTGKQRLRPVYRALEERHGPVLHGARDRARRIGAWARRRR
ncbi:GNAT family N-acetyltransferase [Haliangium sp.]|uniref:GNAT family N-acetyltransferase n=1 Tax=Haliangium sp. TaxID=2663208 RepID=UPI003D110801